MFTNSGALDTRRRVLGTKTVTSLHVGHYDREEALVFFFSQLNEHP